VGYLIRRFQAVAHEGGTLDVLVAVEKKEKRRE